MNLLNYIHWIAPIIGLVTLLIGIGAVLKPEFMSGKFGISVRDGALPYVVSTGIRDVFMGLTVLILYYYDQWLLLGAINLFLAVVAISDFLVVRKYGDHKTSFVHLTGAIAVTVYGILIIMGHLD